MKRWVYKRPIRFIQARHFVSTKSPRQSIEEPVSSTSNNGTSTRVRTRDVLPLPPIMDPETISAREKWRTAKARPDHSKLTEFQKRLHANAHAHALASPVRRCTYSDARLPEHFLLSLNIKNHPETKNPWFLPTTLLPRGSNVQKIGPSLRVLLRQSLVRHLSAKKTHWMSILEFQISKILGSRIARTIWRDDMSEFVLNLLRQQVIRRLRWLLEHPDEVRIEKLRDRVPKINKVDNVSCVIQLAATLPPEIRELSMRTEESAEYIISDIIPQFSKIHTYVQSRTDQLKLPSPPPLLVPAPPFEVEGLKLEFPTMTHQRTQRVPVYPLRELLGRDGLVKLVEGTEYEQTHWVVLKSDARNVGLEVMMMKLQGYLADRKV